MATLPSSRISPTAHYTGYVWLKNGLSHSAFATTQGRLLYGAAQPVNALSSALGGSSLEDMLLARHRVIDHHLEQAIESREIGQVIEVAAGLSPRGLRFCERYPQLRYVEADLPAMADRKRAILADASRLSERHRVVVVDALSDDSVTTVLADELEAGVGTALITEGLLTYFDPDKVLGMWRRFARALGRFPAGLYLSDLHVDADMEKVRGARVFRRVLNQMTRGRHHTYFSDEPTALAMLEKAGFQTSEVPYASNYASELELAPRQRTGRVRIVIARV